MHCSKIYSSVSFKTIFVVEMKIVLNGYLTICFIPELFPSTCNFSVLLSTPSFTICCCLSARDQNIVRALRKMNQISEKKIEKTQLLIILMVMGMMIVMIVINWAIAMEMVMLAIQVKLNNDDEDDT